MSDKSELERDIELLELRRTPVHVRILIVLLLTGLCVLGIYAYSLKLELAKKEHEISSIRENFQKEKNGFPDRTKKLP
ncbi:MAG: hypothetical protein C4560_13095 [Nitrospiraceae bacterium]|nr:MAG: hypothetical protein C4560_13095 [Nitrospiraceae bacterium]